MSAFTRTAKTVAPGRPFLFVPAAQADGASRNLRRRLGCERGSTGSRGTGVGCSARNRSGFWWLPGTGGFGGTAAGGGWSRSRSCDIAQRVPLVLPALLPAAPDVLPAVPEVPLVLEPPGPPVPAVEEVEPAPVSVLGIALVVPGTVPDAVVVVLIDVVSLVVDVVVGVVEVVEVVVVVEPGVALAPLLLYEVLAPLLQPARAELASAMAAR